MYKFMQLKDLKIGDVILAKEVNNVGISSPKSYEAAVVEKGRKYIYFQVNDRRIQRELSDSLPSGIAGHYTSDYFLFKDETQFAEYLLLKEARNKLARFLEGYGAVSKLSDKQVEEISKIIGIK